MPDDGLQQAARGLVFGPPAAARAASIASLRSILRNAAYADRRRGDLYTPTRIYPDLEP
jgi:hypothetical protein